MGCPSIELNLAQDSLQEAGKSAASQVDQAVEFVSFGDEIRRELDPTGPLERLLSDYVILAAWRLKAAIERQGARKLDHSADAATNTSRVRIRSTAVEQAARCLRESFDAFDACRSLKNPRSSQSIFFGEKTEPKVEPNEWPIVPSAGLEIQSEIDDEDIADWHDRLVFDYEVSDTSPVVKGTWVTVGHVVSLIVDGWTWADILRAHPELTENDIRACVTYAMDEENAIR